jgi:MYXO-CTERM domain-containing protein
MVKHEVSTRNANANRVYIMGASSGAMLTEAMCAVYPDVFKAGAEFSGVPAGCWTDGWSAASNWGGTCANGQDTMTAAQWGALARGMYSGYTGSYPRMQLWHGTADATINYNNETQAILQWTNLLGLSATPISTDTTSTVGFTILKWQNSPCGYTVLEAHEQQGGGHTTPIDSNSVINFFGLNNKSTVDPQVTACSGGGGASGTGGASSTGGAKATGGMASTGGVKATGGTMSTGGAVGNVGGAKATGGVAGTGGAVNSVGGTKSTGGATSVVSLTGGTQSTGGAANAGGSKATGGAVGNGGTLANGGAVGNGGTNGNGGSPSTGGLIGNGGTGLATGGGLNAGGASDIGGNSASAGTAGGNSDNSGSCSCRVAGEPKSSLGALGGLLGLALLRNVRRRKSR